MKKVITIAFAIFALVLLFGCTQQTDQGSVNETKLTTTQGIDILKDKIVVSDLTPGSIGTISFTVRDNLGGVTAKDIIVGLDNLGLFKVNACGKDLPPNSPRNCSGYFGYDKYLPVNEHGVPRMDPGQEINFFWRIRAPSQQELGYIALKHPLYYFLSYTYFTSTSQTMLFMSQQELIRRQQSNETVDLSGQTKLSAGEITVNLVTQQPIVYFYTYPNSDRSEPPYDFTLLYDVKNVGDGFPISDILLITELPNGIIATSNAKSQGWYRLNDPNCMVYHVTYFENGEINQGKTISCSKWIKYVFGNDVYNELSKGDTYVYVLGYTELPSKGKKIPLDLELTSQTLTNMKETSTPMKFFTFQSYVVYRYYKEGETNINVYPLRD